MPSRRSSFALLLSLALSCLALLPAHAVQSDEVLSDPALEARARTISEGLRCLVCQNQSIDDSDAPLAKDLRLLVRERLKAGDSDQQIVDFVVARYGEFVLLKPRLAAPYAAVVVRDAGGIRRRAPADLGYSPAAQGGRPSSGAAQHD